MGKARKKQTKKKEILEERTGKGERS